MVLQAFVCPRRAVAEAKSCSAPDTRVSEATPFSLSALRWELQQPRACVGPAATWHTCGVMGANVRATLCCCCDEPELGKAFSQAVACDVLCVEQPSASDLACAAAVALRVVCATRLLPIPACAVTALCTTGDCEGCSQQLSVCDRLPRVMAARSCVTQGWPTQLVPLPHRPAPAALVFAG
jgi:hypothetical protein